MLCFGCHAQQGSPKAPFKVLNDQRIGLLLHQSEPFGVSVVMVLAGWNYCTKDLYEIGNRLGLIEKFPIDEVDVHEQVRFLR